MSYSESLGESTIPPLNQLKTHDLSKVNVVIVHSAIVHNKTFFSQVTFISKKEVLFTFLFVCLCCLAAYSPCLFFLSSFCLQI